MWDTNHRYSTVVYTLTPTPSYTKTIAYIYKQYVQNLKKVELFRWIVCYSLFFTILFLISFCFVFFPSNAYNIYDCKNEIETNQTIRYNENSDTYNYHIAVNTKWREKSGSNSNGNTKKYFLSLLLSNKT